MINSFDSYFFHLINQTLTAGWLDFLMVKFSDKFFWIPFYCVMIWFIVKQFGKKSIFILAFLGLAILGADKLTSGFLKPLLKRQRPCFETSLTPRVIDACNDTGSMPSSHAANHFAIAVFIILLQGIRKKTSTIFWLVWAFSIAYSRVYCGVHYPTDVIVGAALGAAIGATCYLLFKQTERRIKWK